jgi:hypothetical protein
MALGDWFTNGPWRTIAARVTTRTVLAPLIVVMIVLGMGIFLPIALFGPPDLHRPLLYSLFVVLLFILGAYCFYSGSDPDRLQSEDHRIAQKQLMLVSSGEKSTILDDSGEAVPAPFRSLPNSGIRSPSDLSDE